MKQGRSVSTCTLVSSKNSLYINSNQKNHMGQNEINENLFYQQFNNYQMPLQNDSNLFMDSTHKYLQQSPFTNSSGFNQSGLMTADKHFAGILQNSSNVIHNRSQSNISMKNTNDVTRTQQQTPQQGEKQRRKSMKQRQMSEMEIKKMNTENFIQSMNESQRSNNNSMLYGNSSMKNGSYQINNQMNDSNMYTFSKLNEIRTQLKEQKDVLELKQQQRDALKSHYDKESYKFEQKIMEIKQMIMDEEEINQKQQIIIKEQPEKRLQAIKKVFINSEKLFESLQKVDYLFENECRRNMKMNHFEEFKRQQMPILGSLEKLFFEKQNVILKIYEKQDVLENSSENRKMQQSDLEGYELRNIELALECDDLEAYIEMLKSNEDDCQILQQINLRNVWMCLLNELNKLKQRIQETQQVYNDLDVQSRAIEKQIEVEVNQTKQVLSAKEQSLTPQEKIEELSLKEYVKAVLNDLGREAYEEIEFLFDGEKIGQAICDESFKQDYEQIPIFQNKMMNLVKSFQQVIIDEFQSYSNKYNELSYKGEQEGSFTSIKKQLLSNVKIDYRTSKCGQAFERMLDLNSLFSRIIINCKYKEEVVRIQRKVIDVFTIKKTSFQQLFDEQKILCNLKQSTDQKSDELMRIQNEKLIVMAKLDQMKNREKELVQEIEKQEQNTIPFFTTENLVPNLTCESYRSSNNLQTKRTNCDDSYIFDDTTGHLNKTKISQTNNQYLINALNDSHLNYNNNTNNLNNQSQINILNNSQITVTSYNNNTKQYTTLTARTNQNNQSFLEKSVSKNLHTNPNNVSSASLSPSPSTSKIQGLPPKKQNEHKSQSAHYQAQYERKTQVDKIYIRMSEIKIQKDANNRYIREIIAAAEKEYPIIEQIETETKSYTTDLLNLNAMQKEHAEKLIQVYHHFFDDLIENFIRKLEGYILIQQEVPLNEYTPALNFFFTRETLTPIAKLKLLEKKMDDLKAEEVRLLSGWVEKIKEIENEIILITQRMHQIQILYSKYDIPLGDNQSQLFFQAIQGGAIPQNSCQSSSSSAFGGGMNNDQSLNLSDIQGGSTAQKHNRIQSSLTGMKYNPNFCNENSLLQQQFGNSFYNKQSSHKSSSSSTNLCADKSGLMDQNTTRYISNISQKLRIHNSLIEESNKENIIKQFKGDQGIQLYKMFQVNQGNLVKSQIFDPLTQKKHPQMCGYGLRKISINNDEVVFFNLKNQTVDLTIKMKDFTNIFIHPVTLEIIKYQTMSSNNKLVQRNSVKKFLEANYYPFALEVKQTGRIECLCENFQTLKLVYTLFVSALTDNQYLSSSLN